MARGTCYKPAAVNTSTDRPSTRGGPSDRIRTHLRSSLGPVHLFVVALALVSLVLAAESHPRSVGDGREYLAMAQSFARGEVPIYSEPELDRAVSRLDQHVGFRTTGLRQVVEIPGGRYVMNHMWVYSALAAPGVALAEAFGVHPNYAFLLLNLMLFLGAAFLVASRGGVAMAVLLFGSLLLWWIDKAHTEVFTVSLLAVAVVMLRDRPVVSVAAVGLAAAQNIAAAPLVPLAVAAAFAARGTLRDRQVWIGGGVASALVLVHVGWYMALIGRPTAPITEHESFHLPSAAEAATWLWDSNVSLVPYAPLLVVVVLVSLMAMLLSRRATMPWPETTFSILGLAALLIGFSQTDNINSGGTPGPMRYTLWLIPLAIPVLTGARAAFGRNFDRAVVPAAILSCLITILFFRPIEDGRHRHPSWVADYLWTHLPDVENPLPEIFYERAAQREQRPIRPVAFGTCSKVLVVGGAWPDDCRLEVDLPTECLPPSAHCYANEVGDGHVIRSAPRRGSEGAGR
jgi:hypothetical protein